MAISNATQLKLMYKQMHWLHNKMETHADNMSRSAIPKQKTLEIESFSKSLQRGKNPVGMNQTNPAHMAGTGRKSEYLVRVAREQPEASLSGNSISPEQQLSAMNETSTGVYELEQMHRNIFERATIGAAWGGRK